MINDSRFMNNTNTNIKIRDFTDLHTWQEGHTLVILINKITKSFPKEEMYSLIDQMRRAAISITSNIAERFGRQTYKEKVQFYLLTAQINLTHQLLQGLITKSKSFVNHKS